jgi:3-oxoacyl-[acyl-carrier protein] reductase
MTYKKVALITGATGSIGSAIAWSLFESGIDVVLGYLNSKQAALDMLSSWGTNHTCTSIRCDVSKRDSIVATFAAIYQKYGRIDYLVNNAAYTQNIPENEIYDIPDETVEKILDINFKGAMWCCFEALQYMIKESEVASNGVAGKSIVNVCSNALKTHNASNLVYISSKAALQSLTESLAWHYGKYARFNSVAPGLISSSMTDERFNQVKDRVLSVTPTGVLVSPEDVAATVSMLLLSSSAINGQTLYVDGGRTIGN